MKKPILLAAVSGVTFLILTTFASAEVTSQDAATGINTLARLIKLFTETVIKATGTLLLSAAVVTFFFGVVQYIWGLRQGDSGKVKIGNDFMVWGLIGLFVMFSVYGIIRFGQGILFNGKDITSITIPDIKLKSGTSPGGTPSPNVETSPFGDPTPNAGSNPGGTPTPSAGSGSSNINVP